MILRRQELDAQAGAFVPFRLSLMQRLSVAYAMAAVIS